MNDAVSGQDQRDSILRLDGIEKGYNPGRPNEVRVLRGAELRIAAGEYGRGAGAAPSGAGKIDGCCISRGLLDTPDTGRGRDRRAGPVERLMTARGRRARREMVGFVYQFHHLLPEFTAAENIVLPQLANGATKAEAEGAGGRPPGPRRAFRRGWSTGPRRSRAAGATARGVLP